MCRLAGLGKFSWYIYKGKDMFFVDFKQSVICNVLLWRTMRKKKCLLFFLTLEAILSSTG